MDDAWLWGILFAIAAMIAPVTASMAPTLIDRSPRGAWWCIILAPAPLIAWNIAWVVMSNPPDNIRRTATVVIGAVAGALILLGVTELLRRPADAQQRPQPKSTEILMSQSSDLSPPVNTGPESIVTFGQSGGVNTVYNGETPCGSWVGCAPICKNKNSGGLKDYNVEKRQRFSNGRDGEAID